MGSVQNLIGMPSNGYVPKVAVQNTIAIYNFFFKKNIWAKYWWRILCFNHSIHKWFKNIFNHIALPNIWNFTLLYAVTLNKGQQRPLADPFLWAVFHSSETHYDLGCRDIRQMAMSTHISRLWQNHFQEVAMFSLYYSLSRVK